MVIWRGCGLLVPLFIYLGGNAFKAYGYVVGLSINLVLAVLLWFIGKAVYEESGESHSFFFIPVEIWAFITAVFSFGGYGQYY